MFFLVILVIDITLIYITKVTPMTTKDINIRVKMHFKLLNVTKTFLITMMIVRFCEFSIRPFTQRTVMFLRVYVL